MMSSCTQGLAGSQESLLQQLQYSCSSCSPAAALTRFLPACLLLQAFKEVKRLLAKSSGKK